MSIDTSGVTQEQFDIYMDGFTSGLASALQTIYGNTVPDEAIDLNVRIYLKAFLGDPVARECVRVEIAERLAGIDTPKPTLDIYGGPS